MRIIMLEVNTEYKEMNILRVLVYFLNFFEKHCVKFYFYQ